MIGKNVSVLGLHPSSRGFGWVLLEKPGVPFDWGAAQIFGSRKNARAMKRIERLFDKYRPAILCLEQFEEAPSRRTVRIRNLYRRIVEAGKSRRMEVRIYGRGQIAEALEATSSTRDDIAAVVAARLPALRPRLPRSRKPWDNERPTMAMFSAASCALACFAIDRTF